VWAVRSRAIPALCRRSMLDARSVEAVSQPAELRPSLT
jgi:hypothetical protein